MTMGRIAVAGVTALMLASFAAWCAARAEDPPVSEVTIRDHRFTPAEIHVPTGKPVILRITNADDTAEEFDSTALQIEKVIVGGHYGIVRLRPLGPGRFPFMGECHADTAKGVVVSE